MVEIKIIPPPINSHWHRAQIKFPSPCTPNQYTQAAQEAVSLVREIYQSPSIGFRQLWRSQDQTEVTLELVDVLTELKEEKTADQDVHICQVTLTCRLCRSEYRGWQKLNKRQFKPGPYHQYTEYCPNCPPVGVEEWLVGSVELLTERPVYTPAPVGDREYSQPVSRVNLTLDELDDMPD